VFSFSSILHVRGVKKSNFFLDLFLSVRVQVTEVTKTDVKCRVLEGGTLGSRRHLNVRGKSASLPSITDRDWLDIKFGERGVKVKVRN
jgi:pyruvate kinase